MRHVQPKRLFADSPVKNSAHSRLLRQNQEKGALPTRRLEFTRARPAKDPLAEDLKTRRIPYERISLRAIGKGVCGDLKRQVIRLARLLPLGEKCPRAVNGSICAESRAAARGNPTWHERFFHPLRIRCGHNPVAISDCTRFGELGPEEKDLRRVVYPDKDN